MNASFIFVMVVLLASVTGSVVVLACVDVLRPPMARPRVDHQPQPTPLKGLARERVKRPIVARPITLRTLGATLRGLRAEGRL